MRSLLISYESTTQLYHIIAFRNYLELLMVGQTCQYFPRPSQNIFRYLDQNILTSSKIERVFQNLKNSFSQDERFSWNCPLLASMDGYGQSLIRINIMQLFSSVLDNARSP